MCTGFINESIVSWHGWHNFSGTARQKPDKRLGGRYGNGDSKRRQLFNDRKENDKIVTDKDIDGECLFSSFILYLRWERSSKEENIEI